MKQIKINYVCDLYLKKFCILCENTCLFLLNVKTYM